jgi:hypothetical protein
MLPEVKPTVVFPLNNVDGAADTSPGVRVAANFHLNLSATELLEHAIMRGEGSLS